MIELKVIDLYIQIKKMIFQMFSDKGVGDSIWIESCQVAQKKGFQSPQASKLRN